MYCVGGNDMTRDEFEKICWRYYLVLENAFDDVLNYVELDERNYTTFSYEFIRQIQTIGAEIDSVFKVICGFGSGERKNSADYYPIILGNYPDIKTRSVSIRGLTITPFENWDSQSATKSLFWYKAYNDIKHGRAGGFESANLKNVLYALAGLFLLEMYYFRTISGENEPDVPVKKSKIFSIVGWNPRWISSAETFLVTY